MSNWIPISERLPTREDADETGNVLKRWKNGDIAPGPWNTKPETGSTYVAWMPIPPYTPPKPVGPDEVTVSVWPDGAMSLMHGHPPAVQVRYLRADLAARKVKPLTDDELAMLRDEDHGHSFHDDFKDIMAARGIEVGE